MNRIQFDFNNCVHVYFKDSSCRNCIDVCPVEDVLYQEDYKIKIKKENCVSCGACVGVCPSEAFSLKGFDIYSFYKNFISQNTNILSCKKNLPCLSVLSTEFMISMVLAKKQDIVLDTGHCSDCFVGSLIHTIKKNLDEANYFLEKLGVENRVVSQEISLKQEGIENKRRDFLKNFGKAAAGVTFWALMPGISSFEEKEEKIKNIVSEKVNITKRKALLENLKNLDIDLSQIDIETENISFTSEKWIDNSVCTNCSVCYNICPTGALKSGEERLKILFEPKLCIKCRVCHEVCPENCLHLKNKLNLNTFLNDTEILAEHVMIPCEECMVPFSYKGDTTLCPRCRELEQEIKDLLKIGE